MKRKTYFVYILASRSLNFYVGLSSNLHQRVWQHRQKIFDGFSSRYRIVRLVYWESFDDVRNAIDREKQLKRWSRKKKIELIKRLNPTWIDLAEDWYNNADPSTLPSQRSGPARDGKPSLGEVKR